MGSCKREPLKKVWELLIPEGFLTLYIFESVCPLKRKNDIQNGIFKF